MSAQYPTWLNTTIWFHDYPFDTVTKHTASQPTINGSSEGEPTDIIKKETPNVRFWNNPTPSAIQLALQAATHPELNPDIRPGLIDTIWQTLQKLKPFVTNDPNRHFHLFLDDLNRCWHLGFFQSFENIKLIVKLSHPLDWIDFCCSLPFDSKILNREQQCNLLKEAMIDYPADVFDHTFSLAIRFNSKQFEYAPYLAAAVVGTRYRFNRLSSALELEEPKTNWGEATNKHCFYLHFIKTFYDLNRRHNICEDIKKNIQLVKDQEQKQVLEQFVSCWEIKGWEMDFEKLTLSSLSVKEVQALASLYKADMEQPSDQENLHLPKLSYLTLIDSLDLASLLGYLKDESNTTLRGPMMSRIVVNWVRGKTEEYTQEIKQLTEDDIPTLIQILDPGSFDSDSQEAYKLILKALIDARRFQYKQKLQAEVEKIKIIKEKKYQWRWEDDVVKFKQS